MLESDENLFVMDATAHCDLSTMFGTRLYVMAKRFALHVAWRPRYAGLDQVNSTERNINSNIMNTLVNSTAK